MQITGLHHVAFAHESDSPINDRLRDLLGLEPTHTEDGDGFVERMIPTGECFVQTLEATGSGTIERFVSKRGNGLHHVAFSVDGLDEALRELETANVELIDRVPRPGGMGTRIAFIHPRAFGGLLVELVDDETPG